VHTRRDGSEITVLSRWVLRRDECGHPDAVLEINTDLTARKQAEQASTEHGRRLQLLHHIDRAILAAHSPKDIAATALQQVREVTGVERASIMLFDPQLQEMTLLAVDGAAVSLLPPGLHVPMDWPWLAECRRGQIAIVEDFATLPNTWPETGALLAHNLRSSVGFPLTVGQQVIGALTVARAESGPPPEDLLSFGRQLADSLAVTLQNARLFSQLEAARQQARSFSHRLVEALEDERRTIARELHDEAGQSLTTLNLGLGQLKREPAQPQEFEARIADLQQITSSVMEELHRIAVNLRPVALDRYGLVPAFEQYVEAFGRHSGLKVQLAVAGLGGEQRYAPEIETALYRVLQEALTNVARHAQATRAGVVVESRGATLTVIVEDNGRGFDLEQALNSGRLGLLGMRERAEMLGGTLTIETSPGAGCSVYVSVPLSPVPV
jgi:signal transduction histidine kinase